MPVRKPKLRVVGPDGGKGRTVGKKPAPLGNDIAFSLSSVPSKLSTLTYWDLWFALVTEMDFGSDLGQLATHLKERSRKGCPEGRDSLERKLSHLRDLEKRLSQLGLGIADVLCAAGTLAKSELRRARDRVLERPVREPEWSKAMRTIPRERRYAQALRGRWSQFPVPPTPYAEKMRSRFKTKGFYSERQTVKVSHRLDGYVDRANRLLSSGSHAEAQALLRAWLTTVIEIMGMADDSCGCIGDSFRRGFRLYQEIPLEKTGITDSVFFPDLLDFLIWEDYGLTNAPIEGYFRRLTPTQGDLCIAHLRRQIGELKADDLDYQSEEALTLLGQVVAEQARFEQFVEIAREMGSREWLRIIRLVDRAVKRRRRKLAIEVFEAALTAGFHLKFLTERYEQLKHGKWNPDSRK